MMSNNSNENQTQQQTHPRGWEIQKNQIHKHSSRFTKYEISQVRQLISDTLILDLSEALAGQYINLRSMVYVSLDYYRVHKSKLKNNKNILELIANHKRVGYVAAYFDSINEIKFVKALVVRALYNGVNDNADGKSIAALAMALDKLEQTYIVLNTGSPFMEMIVDELVKNNQTNTNTNELENRKDLKSLILKKGEDGYNVNESHDIQRTIDRVLDRDRPVERTDSESPENDGEVRNNVEETESNPPSSLLLPEDDKPSGTTDAESTGSEGQRDTNSTRRLPNGEDVDSTGVDPSEAIFR